MQTTKPEIDLRTLYVEMKQARYAPKVAAGLTLKNADGSFQIGSIEQSFLDWRDGFNYCAALASPVSTGIAGDERALFERHEAASELTRDTDGDYANPYVQSAWDGWQARAAVPAQPTQPQPPILYARQFDLDNHAGRGVLTYAEAEDSWNVPLYAQPQQVEGAAPTHQAESIPPFAEPAGQLDAEYEASRDTIIRALSEHRMVRMFEVEDDGLGNSYPLIDRLTLDDGADIESGKVEIEAIADAVLDALAEQTRSGAVSAGLSPNESTLSPEPAKVGGDIGQLKIIVERVNLACYDGEHIGLQKVEQFLAAKASGVQAADLLKELRDEYLTVMSSAYCQSDANEELLNRVEALFNPAPTGETE